MKTAANLMIVGTLCISLIVVPTYFLFFNTNTPITKTVLDTTPPTITTVTGNLMSNPGDVVPITVTYSDDTNVTTAKLFYKPSSADHWSSKPILNGYTSISLPGTAEEPWYYYVTVDDQAGNGPVGSPSNDGSTYYSINILPNDNSNQNNDSDQNQSDDPPFNNTIRHAFIEMGTKIVCSECPKISALLNEMYKSGNYPFYYVSLPMTDEHAIERLTEYNIYGYPTMYIDGGYSVLVGSSIQKTDLEQKINDALSRPRPNISIDLQASKNKETNETTISLIIHNQEKTNYNGHLRVYLTEIVSTSGESNTPQRFLFHRFLFNEAIELSANGEKQLSTTNSLNGLDPENAMIVAAVFNAEKNTGYSQLPDKNPFDAYYVDAVAAVTVVDGGNIPPAVGIQSPKVNSFHRFGNPVRKSFLGRTVLLGKTMIVANASDDSAISKVEFYVDDKLMGTTSKQPFCWTWNSFAIGKHTIMVKAYDDNGKTSSANLDVVAFIKWKGPLSTILSSLFKSSGETTSSGSCH
jgi:hypothetical protein